LWHSEPNTPVIEPHPQLSICIATFNRVAFLKETLEHLMAQVTSACEIVVSDNASTDDTAAVMAELAKRCAAVRYVRQPTNVGLDRNFDHAVEHARGEYCWLFSDDDLPRPGAVARVLATLDRSVSVVFTNIEFRSFDMTSILCESAMRVRADTLYDANELDRLFCDVDLARVYVGNIIIRRELWRSRSRQQYYDSMFLHVGVVYQSPLPQGAWVVAEPLVSYRMANPKAYSAELDEIWLHRWPAVVRSLALSEKTKRIRPSAAPAAAQAARPRSVLACGIPTLDTSQCTPGVSQAGVHADRHPSGHAPEHGHGALLLPVAEKSALAPVYALEPVLHRPALQ